MIGLKLTDDQMEVSLRHGALSGYPSLTSYDEFVGDRRLDLQAGRLFVAGIPSLPAIGYACIDPTDFLGWPLLSRLCIAPERRGLGIGNRFITYLQEQTPYPRLYTSTEVSNLTMQKILGKQNALLIGHADQLNFNDEREMLYRLK